MKRGTVLAVPLALALALCTIGAPLAAQDEGESPDWPQAGDHEAESGDADEMGAIAAMIGGLFQAEPLTPEQEARLPAATGVVGTMMPEGFYGKMMAGVMEKTMRPMMAVFASPQFILSSRLEIDAGTIEGLSEDERNEILAMLDPAWDRRVDAIVGVVTGNMVGMFEAVEPPMREGLSRAYAVRFDEAQLADIAAFFGTPTGKVYAQESMALFADPQVMSSTMQALPAMMGGFTDMKGSMQEAMNGLPAERGYADLGAAERARMAKLLGVAPGKLKDVVRPPAPLDGAETLPGN